MSGDHEIELSNETLLLRPFLLDDAPALHAAVRESMTELGQWLSWCHPDYSLQDSLKFLGGRGEAHRKDGEYGFAIIDRSHGRFLGGCGINQLDEASLRANLGYWVRTDRKSTRLNSSHCD
jgi:ribosomal-protein-serine acetyltransferase